MEKKRMGSLLLAPVYNNPQANSLFHGATTCSGKVFVFTGIFSLAPDDASLAHVLSHEIAHNLAHHTAERLSRRAIYLPALLALSFMLDVSGQAAGFVLSLLYEWPGSRREESEADKIGLMMMARACYDPTAAVGLWTRMEKEQRRVQAAGRGGQVPAFLSTHPSDRNRIRDIEGWMPDARDVLEQSECGSTIGFVDQFRKSRAVFGHVDVAEEEEWAKPQTGGEKDFW